MPNELSQPARRWRRFAARLLPWPVYALLAAATAAFAVYFFIALDGRPGRGLLVAIFAVLATGCTVYTWIVLRRRGSQR